MTWHEEHYEDNAGSELARVMDNLATALTDRQDPRDIFSVFTRHLEKVYAIKRGFLAIRDGDLTRFTAVASWRQGHERRNLSLALPQRGSLLQKVAEDGQVYAETFAQLYDGNMIERRLLMDDDTQAFMLRPLKHAGRVVAMLAYASDDENAFAAFNESVIDPLIDRFAEAIARYCQPASELRS